MGQIAHRTLITLSVLIFLAFCAKVVADSTGRGTAQPFSKESGDHVFVNFAGFNYENKETYLENKAEFYRNRCKNRERITEQEKRECESLDVLKRYPHSGVYHKDNPSKPVWWGGSCGVSYLTADANYVVQMGSWASHVNQQAVRFCKRQNIIAEYAIRDLVDDENRLPRLESHLNWRDKVSFDNNQATLYIKTLDNNEYTFDVRTGKIIEYKYTPFKSYEARVFYKNKTDKIVRDITSCSGMTYATVFMGNGFPVHQLQIVEPIKKENGGDLVQTGAIPFEHISEARYITSADQRAIWEITTPQGQSGQVTIDSIGADLCGKADDGKEIKISMMEIAGIKMSLTKSVPSREGVRTVEQRMRWDIKHWDKDRRMICENTSSKDFNTAWDYKNLIRQFRYAKCTDQSDNVVVAMDRTNQWLQQQQPSEETVALAKEAAEFQMQARLPGRALIPYEYLLKSYQIEFDERDKRQLIKMKQLLSDMISVSWSAGLMAEYEKYRKRSDVIVAIMEEQNAKVKEQKDNEKREKIKAYHRSIENIAIASVEPGHRFPDDTKRLLDWECQEQKKAVISAADTYKSILALEKKLHPEGHVHVLEAGISLSNCHKLKRNSAEARKSFDKVLSQYLQMDKKGELSSGDSLAINRKFMRLMVQLTADRNELIDETVALNLRKLIREKESNNHKAMFETLRALAKSYSLLGDNTKAEEYYKERIKLSAKLDDRSRNIAKSELERYYEQREYLKQIGSRAGQ